MQDEKESRLRTPENAKNAAIVVSCARAPEKSRDIAFIPSVFTRVKIAVTVIRCC